MIESFEVIPGGILVNPSDHETLLAVQEVQVEFCKLRLQFGQLHLLMIGSINVRDENEEMKKLGCGGDIGTMVLDIIISGLQKEIENLQQSIAEARDAKRSP